MLKNNYSAILMYYAMKSRIEHLLRNTKLVSIYHQSPQQQSVRHREAQLIRKNLSRLSIVEQSLPVQKSLQTFNVDKKVA